MRAESQLDEADAEDDRLRAPARRVRGLVAKLAAAFSGNLEEEAQLEDDDASYDAAALSVLRDCAKMDPRLLSPILAS